MPVLASFGLNDPDDALRAVDVARLEPRHFAGAKTAAIGERQHEPKPEAVAPATVSNRMASPGLKIRGRFRGSLM